MKQNNVMHILSAVFGLISIVVFTFYFYYNITSHKPRQVSHSYTEFNSWEQVYEDGTRVKLKLPTSLDNKNDSKSVIETTLPSDLTGNEWINFNNGYDCDVYIDGVLRKQFRETDSDIPGGIVKGVKQFCKLSKDDAGKVIRIERDKEAKYFSYVYIGDSLGLVSHYLYQGAATYVVTITLLAVSVIVIFFGIFTMIVRKRRNTLVPLGVGVAYGSLWQMFDSPMYQFVFDNFYIDGVMSYMLASLLAFPFLVCVDTLQGKRHGKANFALGCILLANSIVCAVLHFSNTIPYDKTLFVSNIIICIVVICFLSTMIADFVKGLIESRIQVYGLFGGLLCGIVEVILINIDETRNDGAFILLGLWIILSSAVAQYIKNTWKVEQERQRAISANEAKSEFLAKISHEIRTPINAILGMDEMILRESGESEVKQYASDIKIATNNLLEIINEILDSSKIESGKMEIIEANYKLANMLNDLYNMISVKAEEKGLKLTFEIDETIPSELFGDDVRIRQVLVNLLTNAVKYTEKGSVTLKLSMSKNEENAILKFSVEDTGIGIKKSEIGLLFSEYQRIDQVRNKYVEGTGLGMSITTKLLKLMGSELKVDSIYGKGSIFSFEIEQGVVSEKSIGDFRKNKDRFVEADKVESYVAPDAKILVVDDNDVNRKVFTLLLKKMNMQITDVSSGQSCLINVVKEKYDIIFLDHMMPEMDGIETLKNMKQLENNLNKDTPIIMFTANAIKGAKEFYEENGATDYLTKPVRPDKLDKIILKYLDSSLIKN